MQLLHVQGRHSDVFPVPCVSLNSNLEICSHSSALLSRSWRDLHLVPIELTQVFRQSDATFVELLAQLRQGRVSDEAK